MTMTNPIGPPSASTAVITDDILDVLREGSKNALLHERNYFRFFGPLFDGEYQLLDDKTKVFAFLQMESTEIRRQFVTQAGDFGKFFTAVSQAQNKAKAREIVGVAVSAYKAAEARVQAQIQVLQIVAKGFEKPGFFDELAQYCRLDWSGANTRLEALEDPTPVESRALGEGEEDGGGNIGDDGSRIVGKLPPSFRGPGSD